MAPTPTITVRLPAELIARLDEYAAQLAKSTGLNASRSDAVRLLLEAGMEARGKK